MSLHTHQVPGWDRLFDNTKFNHHVVLWIEGSNSHTPPAGSTIPLNCPHQKHLQNKRGQRKSMSITYQEPRLDKKNSLKEGKSFPTKWHRNGKTFREILQPCQSSRDCDEISKCSDLVYHQNELVQTNSNLQISSTSKSCLWTFPNRTKTLYINFASEQVKASKMVEKIDVCDHKWKRKQHI